MGRARWWAVVLVGLVACGSGGRGPGTEVQVVAATAAPGSAVPTTAAVALDPASAANRTLRATLPELPGATLVGVEDVPSGAADAMTTWTYEVEGSTKCAMTGAFEGPMADAGWVVQTFETQGLGGPPVGNIRASELYRHGAFVSVTVDAPPRRLVLRVEAVSSRLPPGAGDGPAGGPWPCLDVLPEPPPDPPDADLDAELADNEAVFAMLPVPMGATVVEQFPGGVVAMGRRGQPIGYGSMWRFTVAGAPDPCAVAATYEEALSASGWERFTFQRSDVRNSTFFAPPRSVEVEVAADGSSTVTVMAQGAVVGTRRYPGERIEDFVAGATPESRGEPVPCTFG